MDYSAAGAAADEMYKLLQECGVDYPTVPRSSDAAKMETRQIEAVTGIAEDSDSYNLLAFAAGGHPADLVSNNDEDGEVDFEDGYQIPSNLDLGTFAPEVPEDGGSKPGENLVLPLRANVPVGRRLASNDHRGPSGQSNDAANLQQRMEKCNAPAWGTNRWMRMQPHDTTLYNHLDLTGPNPIYALHVPSGFMRDSINKVFSLGDGHHINKSLATLVMMMTALTSSPLGRLCLPDDYGVRFKVPGAAAAEAAAPKGRGGASKARMTVPPPSKWRPAADWPNVRMGITVIEPVVGRVASAECADVLADDIKMFRESANVVFTSPSDVAIVSDLKARSAGVAMEDDGVAGVNVKEPSTEAEMILQELRLNGMALPNEYEQPKQMAMREHIERERVINEAKKKFQNRLIRMQREIAAGTSRRAGSASIANFETLHGYTFFWAPLCPEMSIERGLAQLISRLDVARNSHSKPGRSNDLSGPMAEYERLLDREVAALMEQFRHYNIVVPHTPGDFAIVVQQVYKFITGATENRVQQSLEDDLDMTRPETHQVTQVLEAVLSPGNAIRMRLAGTNEQVLSGVREPHDLSADELEVAIGKIWGPQVLEQSYARNSPLGPVAMDPEVVQRTFYAIPTSEIRTLIRLSYPMSEPRERSWQRMIYADAVGCKEICVDDQEMRESLEIYSHGVVDLPSRELNEIGGPLVKGNESSMVDDAAAKVRQKFIFYVAQDDIIENSKPYEMSVGRASAELAGVRRKMEVLDDQTSLEYRQLQTQFESADAKMAEALRIKQIEFDIPSLKKLYDAANTQDGNTTGFSTLGKRTTKLFDQARLTRQVISRQQFNMVGGVSMEERENSAAMNGPPDSILSTGEAFRFANGTNPHIPLDPKQSFFQNMIHTHMIQLDRFAGNYNSHMNMFMLDPVRSQCFDFQTGEQRNSFMLQGDSGAGKSFVVELLRDMAMSVEFVTHATKMAYTADSMAAGTVRLMPELDARHVGLDDAPGTDSTLKEALSTGFTTYSQLTNNKDSGKRENQTGLALLLYSWVTAGNFTWSSMPPELRQRFFPVYISSRMSHYEGPKELMKGKNSRIDMEARAAFINECQIENVWMAWLMLANQCRIGMWQWDFSIADEIITSFNQSLQKTMGMAEPVVSSRNKNIIMQAIKHYSMRLAVYVVLNSVFTIASGKVSKDPSLEWVLEMQKIAMVPNAEVVWFVLSLYVPQLLSMREMGLLSQIFKACESPVFDGKIFNSPAQLERAHAETKVEAPFKAMVEGTRKNWYYQQIPMSIDALMQTLTSQVDHEWTEDEVYAVFNLLRKSAYGAGARAQPGRNPSVASTRATASSLMLTVAKRNSKGEVVKVKHPETEEMIVSRVSKPVLYYDTAGDNRCCYLLIDLHTNSVKENFLAALAETCDQNTMNYPYTVALALHESAVHPMFPERTTPLPNCFSSFHPKKTSRQQVVINPYKPDARTMVIYYQSHGYSQVMEEENHEQDTGVHNVGDLQLVAFSRYFERRLSSQEASLALVFAHPLFQANFMATLMAPDAKAIIDGSNLYNLFITFEEEVSDLVKAKGGPRCLCHTMREAIINSRQEYLLNLKKAKSGLMPNGRKLSSSYFSDIAREKKKYSSQVAKNFLDSLDQIPATLSMPAQPLRSRSSSASSMDSSTDSVESVSSNASGLSAPRGRGDIGTLNTGFIVNRFRNAEAIRRFRARTPLVMTIPPEETADAKDTTNVDAVMAKGVAGAGAKSAGTSGSLTVKPNVVDQRLASIYSLVTSIPTAPRPPSQESRSKRRAQHYPQARSGPSVVASAGVGSASMASNTGEQADSAVPMEQDNQPQKIRPTGLSLVPNDDEDE